MFVLIGGKCVIGSPRENGGGFSFCVSNFAGGMAKCPRGDREEAGAVCNGKIRGIDHLQGSPGNGEI